MTFTAAGGRRAARPDGPRKSALRGPSGQGTEATLRPPQPPTSNPVDLREGQRQLYEMSLVAGLSARGKPMSTDTISAYQDAVKSLAAYLTAIGFPGGFQTVDHRTLNDYLRDYRANHTQGGAVTKQGNLRPFFAWITAEFEVESAYDHPDRHVYRREVEAPALLSNEFIDDLLKITAGKDFASLRDNAIIRIFLFGPRNCEVQAVDVSDLNLREKVIMLQPFKGGRKRPIPIPPNTAVVLARYLRARAELRSKPSPTSGPLWLSAKGGYPLTKSGIYQMLKRRAEEAGYLREDVHPHLFRHTAAHDWLDRGGSEGDAMALFGWTDRSMLDRYGASLRQQRALDAATRAGFGDRPQPGATR